LFLLVGACKSFSTPSITRIARRCAFVRLGLTTTTTTTVFGGNDNKTRSLTTSLSSSSTADATVDTSSDTMGNKASIPNGGAQAATSLEDASEAYKTLKTKLNMITQLERVTGLLDYDQMVFMPEEAAAERGAQLSALATVVHEKATDKELLTLIEQVEDELTKFAAGDKEQFKDDARLLALEKKDFLQNQRISSELAARKALLTSKSHGAWAKARENNDFKSFEPLLKECFDTAKEVAEAKRGDATDIDHYTQMLDDYEMGMSPERIDSVFDEIQTALVPLIEKVLKSDTPPSTGPLKGEFAIDKQKAVNRKIVTALGFDESHGRIDVSVHPFTLAVSPSDVRITSRFQTDEWYQGLAGTIHEGGHAMYEQGLGNTHLKLDSALSMGMHESQSLFWERHVGLSKPFWQWATPILQEEFADSFSQKYSADDMYGAVNAVSRSFIRVEADELTYPLHVILRYQIERDVIQGKLQVKDIPKTWNTKMKEMLGVNVPNDTKGCLQDIHWSMMAIGYFPTYLIGSSAAAQLAYYCKQDIPDFDKKVAAGEFSEIKAWLTQKVHKHGKRYASLDALLEGELGEPLNPKYFTDYLTEKYTELYKC